MKPAIEAIEISKHFRPSRLSLRGSQRVVRAVDNVSLTVYPGEIMGLVGESGCGKSTLASLLLGLMPLTSGEIRLEGKNIHDPAQISLRKLRQTGQMIFQDPYGSLNPAFKIRTSLKEAYNLRDSAQSNQRLLDMDELMDHVGLRRATLEKYPHQLSGGQRQRVVIARALATGARVLVLDEPTSALDVSIRSQILNLLVDLKQELELTYVFISHDLEVIRYLCDRMAVMYLGRIVELGNTQDVLERPRHPYTQGLLAAVPRPRDGSTRVRAAIRGEIPDPANLPSGCRFHPRCEYARPECQQSEPALVSHQKTKRPVACFFPVGTVGSSLDTSTVLSSENGNQIH